MPANAESRIVLVDTSVAIALVVADHDHHESSFQALNGHTWGLAGHAAFETYSVLTRLPSPARRTPVVVAQLLANTFPETKYLSAGSAAKLLGDLALANVAGGSVYDALVGAAAREHQLTLVTRDRRALDTYRALGVDVELLA